MDTLTKEKIDFFFTPSITPLFLTSFQDNMSSIKKDSEIQEFCERELCQGILYVNKYTNIADIPNDILNIIKSYLFKERVTYKLIKFYWYDKYMELLSRYESEDRFDILWYSIDSKDYNWSYRRLLIIEALKKTVGLRLGYKEGDLKKYSMFIL